MSESSLTNTGVAVIIAGLPASANRVFEKLFIHHGIQTQVDHHATFHPVVRAWQADALTVAVFIPVRDAEIHKAGSFDQHMKAYGPDADYDQIRIEQYAKTMEVASELRVPVLAVRYRHFVANPFGIASHILAWLGLQMKGFPEQIIDGDVKWLRKLDPDEQFESNKAAALEGVADPNKEIIAPISATLRGSSSLALRKLQQ